MRIGVIGGGVVGMATARSYIENHEVRVHDVVRERSTHRVDEVMDCDLVFICLPSPKLADRNGLDLSWIEGFLGAHRGSAANLVIKSTVPVGTTRRLCREFRLQSLVHSPEFLTARCAFTDAQLPARNVIGEVQHGPTWKSRTPCGEQLKRLYVERFPGVPVHELTSDESEAVKLIQNSFFATKVAFFNEAHRLCEDAGLDWNGVRAAILADGRIAHSHTVVPGPDGSFGFGGTCLPKDLSQFVAHLAEHRQGLPSTALGALLQNAEDRKRGAK